MSSLALLLLTACSIAAAPEIWHCEKYLSTNDLGDIRKLVLKRKDIQRPIWRIECKDRNRAIVSSGPHYVHAVASEVTVVRRRAGWQITLVQPVEIVQAYAWP